MTVKGDVVVPFGNTETATTFPTAPPPPQPESVRADKTAAVRRIFRVANFLLTISPTNSIRAAEPLLYFSSFSNQTLFVAHPVTGNAAAPLERAADREPECRRRF